MHSVGGRLFGVKSEQLCGDLYAAKYFGII